MGWKMAATLKPVWAIQLQARQKRKEKIAFKFAVLPIDCGSRDLT